MIHIENLSMSYHGHPLFENALFNIQEGERCGLVGRNGSGKTTLFRLIAGEEIQDSGTISIRKNYTIGILNQHLIFTQPTLIKEAALGLRLEDQDSLYKAEKILFGLGFKEEDLERNPQEFSGGYHLRLHLAKVLIAEPNCLLLDEPTNYLDIVSIRWFTRFLQHWKGEFILISHDREFMDNVCTHTMGIYREKIRKIKGGTVSFFEQILQDEEMHERTRINSEKKRTTAQAFIDKFGAKATKAAQAQSRQKMLDRLPVLEKLKEINQLGFHFNEAPFSSQKMLEGCALSFSYTSDQPLIDQVSISIEKGERIAIIGKNGRGKSTFLRLLSGDLSPSSGTLKYSDNLRIGYFGQTNINRLNPKNTIEEEISGANPALNLTQVKGICGLMMFSGDKAAKVTSILSGGEKSRVLLGKILASACNLLLLDEPTHHLDMESIESLVDALEEFQGAVVLVTHSELILKRLEFDKIIICHPQKQELFLGNYESFLEKGGWSEEEETFKVKKKSNEYHEQKQKRSEFIAARSKILKPIEREMASKENLISKLEVEQQEAIAQLLEISKTANGQAIQESSKAIALRKKTLDQLYNQLEEIILRYESL